MTDIDEVEILSTEQLASGTTNENPHHVFRVRLPNGEEGWVAGPHGVSCCAISDWLKEVGKPANSREEAIETGCE